MLITLRFELEDTSPDHSEDVPSEMNYKSQAKMIPLDNCVVLIDVIFPFFFKASSVVTVR